MFNEFKAFLMRGNVIDLAVGVIIGGSFGLIAGSLVNDVLMPILNLLTAGQLDVSAIAIKIGTANIAIGKFLQTVINFVLLAAAVFFLIVKPVNALNKKKEAAPAEPSAQEKLLAEIRDLLKKSA